MTTEQYGRGTKPFSLIPNEILDTAPDYHVIMVWCAMWRHGNGSDDGCWASVDRLANGNFLITATSTIGYLKTSDFAIPTGKRGYDLVDAPATITTRVLLNSGKTQVLAQAVQVKNK